ncbi:LysR family transcriptional regulator [Pandoraea captiosa]|uniref:LysR family transcriptional regulator n=1 Tax=Pandoraea captiosa TaxID=2508302 RepID=A0A5E4ZHE7_9BURK|nr:LysR family transcriptional regulator [Pandoraea captiosa]VVE60524.1 LysR family transcriptional regulator [Pandoraea captiosa]
MLDIQCLKDFHVLAQLKHFGRAAERCHVSTSGLSRRIQSLEVWLGAPVLVRSGAGIELTAAGERLLAVSADAVAALDSVRRAVHAETSVRREQIRFAAPHIMSALFFSAWFPLLGARFQSTRFSVTSDHLDACAASLEAGEEDFLVFLADEANGVFSRLQPVFERGGFRLLTMGHESLTPVCVADARGRAVHSLDGDRTRAVSLLGYSDECSLSWILEASLRATPALPTFKRHHENSLADGLRSMALAGLGVAWLPHRLIADDLVARRLVSATSRHLDIAMHITIARRSTAMSDCAEAFWDYLNDEYGGARGRAPIGVSPHLPLPA